MGVKKEIDSDLIKELYLNGFSSRMIGERLNIDHKTVFRHLKSLGISLRNKSESAKIGVSLGRIVIKKNKLPDNLTMNADLAYILGVLAGDGYLDYSDKRRNWQIGLGATDREFVDNFYKILLNFFKIKPTLSFRKRNNLNWRSLYVCKLCSKEACDYINSIGEFKKYNWFIPNSIKKSNSDIKCSFLRGFFDSEGEIDKSIGRVGATSMNYLGLMEVSLMLGELNIRNTIIKRKDSRPNTHQKYALRIHDKKSIILFSNLIGFTISRKQKVLNNFVHQWTLPNFVPKR